MKKIDGSRSSLNKILNIKPDDYEALKDLGNTYQTVGEINNARKYFQKAISVNNFYAPALTNLGRIELTTGKNASRIIFTSQSH